MKKLFFLFVTFVATTTLWADGFQSGDFYYKITSSFTVEIFGGDESNLTTVVIPETVTNNGTTYSVTTIGDFAFYGYTRLTSVTIPNSITSIGYIAFAECSSLTSITIPNSVTSIGPDAFFNCAALTSVTIPNGVTSIEKNVFKGCSSLTSVTIGNSVTAIGNYAFSGCCSLTSITIPNSVTSIGDHAFQNCSLLTSIILPKNITKIGYGAFSNTGYYNNEANWENGVLYYTNSYLLEAYQADKSISGTYVIKDNTILIADGAFSNCWSLTSIFIPNSVTTIGDGAFINCVALTSVTIPNSVTSIKNSTFSGCSYLTSITIPNSVTSIGERAFANCYSLTSITIPYSVTSIGPDAFHSCGLTSITIPSSVTNIGEQCFEYCSSLTSVTIPNSVTKIEHSVFSYCASLASVTIGTKSIAQRAFYDCSSLKFVTLLNDVTSIRTSAFENCPSLDAIYCYATIPPTLSGSSFDYDIYDKAKFYVPCDALANYQGYWGGFTNIQCISSESAEVNDMVETIVGCHDVTITWPKEDNADTYIIVVKIDGEVFCTLTFNAEGQLLNIAFAPSRDGANRPAQYAEQTGNGYRFTITGLEEGTQYTYDITATDESDNTLATHSGEFTTQSNTPTAIEHTNSLSSKTKCYKIIRDNQLIIIRDGKTYNVMGKEL